MDCKTLKDVKPTDYAEAADGYRAVSDMAGTAKERIDSQITTAMGKANEGEAADAAQGQLRKLSQNFHYTEIECGLISGALNGFSAEISIPRRNLIQALDEATELGFTVNAYGNVTYPAGGKNEMNGSEYPGGTAVGNNGMLDAASNPALQGRDGNGMLTGTGPGTELRLPNPQADKAQDIADRIAHALREANEIDRLYSEALKKLKAAPGLTVNTKTWADVADDVDTVSSTASDYIKDHIPLDKSPADRKQWWDGLSDEERAEYRIAFPEIIGNLDGIPSLVRDDANRENLPLLIAQMEGRQDEGSLTKLEGLRGIQERLEQDSVPPMYLLGIGGEGNGRAVISFGNPDTADNVSAYVPGLGTMLDGGFANGTVNRAFDTANLARQIDPSTSTASIVWLGYDAPQLTAGDLLSGSNVMFKDSAEAGAPAYNSFMGGISATSEKGDPHVTAIGHSYGSLTVGTAAQQPGGIPGADDIILVGSPGVGTDKAADLGVGKEHVWVGAAENDIVTKLPSKQEGLAGIAGGHALPLGGPVIGSILADPEDNELWFGKDPASQDFGANRFSALPGPSLISFPNVLDSDLTMQAHSNYFTPGDEGTPPEEKDPVSARNIAAIVAGQPGYVDRTAPR
ncbi:alpha/beta hydrolase family protein [Streptomyces europaeiscabiei]|uniref:alpha/beta hydrolase n=1 Tax=Streptomyces europaeiscabiei TaxID=146819 RepID=UPI0030E29BF1